ncbi:unnamed protein product, partial [Prorocentrum cordatum]
MVVDEDVPDWFETQCRGGDMSKRHKKGADTGEQKKISGLCELWFLATRDKKTGNIKKVADWGSGWICKSAYTIKETAHTERGSSYTWGQIIGMHFGEKNAKKALNKGGAVCATVAGADGKQHKRFKLTTYQGLSWNQISAGEKTKRKTTT